MKKNMKKSIINMTDKEYRIYRANINSKNRRMHIIKTTLFFSLIIISLVIISGCIKSRATEENNVSVVKYYTYTNLPADKTVSELAYDYYTSEEYCNNELYPNAESYIKDVMEINHINSNTVIAGGKLIYIPYCVEEENE